MCLPIGASPIGNGWGRRKVEQMHVSGKTYITKEPKGKWDKRFDVVTYLQMRIAIRVAGDPWE